MNYHVLLSITNTTTTKERKDFYSLILIPINTNFSIHHRDNDDDDNDDNRDYFYVQNNNLMMHMDIIVI